ncbi:hypothetical protein CHS0354_029191 [Potamilus streckersoni]|uniref:Uncharacterized protein n=1 Tax=Potamilus streckersoni TaxID=2493646 RepID=A0AAE0THH9_9BIVA|nr:hypothetical protein CHS0354_029191 [Potamilus streckersoni]
MELLTKEVGTSVIKSGTGRFWMAVCEACCAGFVYFPVQATQKRLLHTDIKIHSQYFNDKSAKRGQPVLRMGQTIDIVNFTRIIQKRVGKFYSAETGFLVKAVHFLKFGRQIPTISINDNGSYIKIESKHEGKDHEIDEFESVEDQSKASRHSTASTRDGVADQSNPTVIIIAETAVVQCLCAPSLRPIPLPRREGHYWIFQFKVFLHRKD